jgi:integrase
MAKRAGDDWSPSGILDRLPRAWTPTAPKVSCSTVDLLRGWARDQGYDIDARPITRAAYDRLRTITRLGAFLGHEDAAGVTKSDAVRWKEDAQTRGRAAATIRNDLSEMSAVWAWGLRTGKLSGANPFQGVSPAKPKKRERPVRPYTLSEVQTVLLAARQSRSPFLRWTPWLLCFTGARVGEIAQATTGDVLSMGGVTVLRIHDDGEGSTLKTEASRRNVPIHPALEAEGFLAYVGTLPAGSTLWPDIPVSATFGTRSQEASRRMSRWLRGIGVVDPLISPAHSWRHWFIDAARQARIPEEVRDALTGHSRRLNESAGYGHGTKSFLEVLAEDLARIPSPLPADPL